MRDILIAGAGLCGLTTALALLERGYKVRLFEQASELREVGAGVQLGANGSRILIALGLEAAMRRIVCEPEGKEMRLWTTGQSWPVFDLGTESEQRYGAPYWMAHRGDFHSVLLAAVRAAAPDAIRTGAACVGFEQDAESVTLRLESGECVTGDVLLAADGVHSPIRRQMFGEGRAQFTGIIAWRGLVPMERLPPHLRRLVGTNWIGHGGHVVMYPLRRGEILNFVAAVEGSDWQVEESWTLAGTQAECLRDLGHWHEDVHTVIRNIEVPYKWALLGRDPLAQFAQGRVCLLGDAAHPTLPFLAQGANMALEDAVVVARCLDAFPVEQALQRFEAARLERTAAIVRGSSENTKRFHNPALADPAGAAAYIDREFAPDKIRQRYDWLYEYDALRVPV